VCVCVCVIVFLFVCVCVCMFPDTHWAHAVAQPHAASQEIR